MTNNYEKNCKFMRNVTTLDDYPKIKGPNPEKMDLNNLIKSFKTIGFQATNLGFGIHIVEQMKKDKADIYLAFTGNTISSGLREIITWLVKKKKVKGIVTSAAGIEEDIVKCFKPFVVGNFDVPGDILFDKGVGRIGNIFAPFDRYLYFENFIDPFLEELYKKQKGKVMKTTEFIKELGLKINNKESFLFWAAKNDIPVFCPAIHDGSLGDLIYFFRQKHKDFHLDTFSDSDILINQLLNTEKAGAIVLGGGSSKHFLLNSAILREGLDYAVYITTAQEFDGSDSGGNQEEAKTWAKINVKAQTVKIKCDFTIAFPLLITPLLPNP